MCELLIINELLITGELLITSEHTVPIAEQKAKDSVGKENGMNLSDHESSESDCDIDAMCGNEDGYLHSYVPLMTNCINIYNILLINMTQSAFIE
jgi:hypothetical protein